MGERLHFLAGTTRTLSGLEDLLNRLWGNGYYPMHYEETENGFLVIAEDQQVDESKLEPIAVCPQCGAKMVTHGTVEESEEGGAVP